MRQRYLEVTYRKGRPLAAYLYLPRSPGTKSARTARMGAGILVDYSDAGAPIGLEFTNPASITLQEVNSILIQVGEAPATAEELAPLRAA
jgi:uncharacterized protein YuzE